jgi:hypothetical protein
MTSRLLSVSCKFLPTARVYLFRSATGRETGWLSLRDDANSPQVNLLAMALAFLQNLGGQVVGSAAHGGSSLGVHVLSTNQQGSEAKVADLDVHLLVEKQVSGFEVAMDNIARMQVFDGTRDLDDEATDFGHSDVFATLEHICKRAAGAQF